MSLLIKYERGRGFFLNVLKLTLFRHVCVCCFFLSLFLQHAASTYSQSMNLKYERTTNDLEQLKGKKGEEI